jgi:RsiW-degrading membrane proteinase PrsW (M82 family)
MTGALPALVAMWYVDRIDAKRPEPRRTLRLVALAGAISTLPCIAFEHELTALGPQAISYGQALYASFVVAAGVEELAKLLVVYWLVWHRPEFDERLDGIVYATRAGLGFALIENILFLRQAADLEAFALTYALRAVLAVPGHAIWAGFMGYYAARHRFDGVGLGGIGGFAIAVGMHGAYDAAIFAGPPLRADGHAFVAYALMAVPPAIIVGGAVILRRLARAALAADDADEAANAGLHRIL